MCDFCLLLRCGWMQWQGSCLPQSGWDLYQHWGLVPLWLRRRILPQRWRLCEEATSRWVSSCPLTIEHLKSPSSWFGLAKSLVLFLLQVSRTKVCLRTFRMMRWRCCSRCFLGCSSVFWPHWLLKEIWSTPLCSWEQWQPWQATGSLTRGSVCLTVLWKDVKTSRTCVV